MQYRPGRDSDFVHLETFVWQAIFPAFDRPGLSAEQRAENDAMVEGARDVVVTALDRPGFGVFVAWDDRRRTLAGYLVVDAQPRAYAEIVQLIVRRSEWGRGVAAELMQRGTDFIGPERAVQLAVRAYNERAIAFFAKHGFVNTGESAGDYAIDRILLLREADAVPTAEPPVATPSAADPPGPDFPSAADEPFFEPLPDHRLTVEEPLPEPAGDHALATEELPPELTLDPATSTLSEDQLSTLEAFIASARARKRADAGPPPDPPPPARHPEIEFEIDYGERPAEPPTPEPPVVPEPAPAVAPEPPAFEFAFDAPSPSPEAERAAPDPASPATCAACGAELPPGARFCPTCGRPLQPTATAATVNAVPEAEPTAEPPAERIPEPEPVPEIEVIPETEPEPEDILVLEDLGEPAAAGPAERATAAGRTATARESRPPEEEVPTAAELRERFQTLLLRRLTAYFGGRTARKYYDFYGTATDFLALRDGSLSSLSAWLATPPAAGRGERRIHDTLADLVEYFIVETARELHGGLFPQRLLRYQGVDWRTVDLFRLVMDYLDFPDEKETVYTDFVAMPARVLRNASQQYLRAGRDERIFFICDQSVFGNGKHGFAVSDSGIYWKNVLQPAGSATFTTLKSVVIPGDHLAIDGQFFHAGRRLNARVALLLDKLRRMRLD